MLRLKYKLGRSPREIATSVDIANRTVRTTRGPSPAGFLPAVAGRAGRRRSGDGAVPSPRPDPDHERKRRSYGRAGGFKSASVISLAYIPATVRTSSQFASYTSPLIVRTYAMNAMDA